MFQGCRLHLHLVKEVHKAKHLEELISSQMRYGKRGVFLPLFHVSSYNLLFYSYLNKAFQRKNSFGFFVGIFFFPH